MVLGLGLGFPRVGGARWRSPKDDYCYNIKESKMFPRIRDLIHLYTILNTY